MSSVFGALNRFISRLDADAPPSSRDTHAGHGGYGFQVLRNTNPDVPIEPWFDFIIGINGRQVVRFFSFLFPFFFYFVWFYYYFILIKLFFDASLHASP